MSDEESPTMYRCFHCKEEFDYGGAVLHFGPRIYSDPMCTVDAKKYREMEELMHRYQQEDTDLHRQIHSLQHGMKDALRQEEEKGYARGLQDMKAETLKKLPVLLREAHALAPAGLSHLERQKWTANYIGERL